MIKKIQNLPKGPGVYLFKKDREVLYIGKAVNIRERVKQHRELLSLAKQLGYIKTDSEIEALILEANLIKKYQPKYNVVWRDDKNYFFVGITKEDFPRVFITHQPKQEVRSMNYEETKKRIFKSSGFNLQTSYVGPFVDGNAIKQTLKILRKVFPYRDCNKIPKHPCLWYQLNRCSAPCLLISNLAKQIYRGSTSIIERECKRNAKNLIKVLQGRKIQVLKNLKKEMKKASTVQDFEKAVKIRDQIEALKKVISHARIFEPAGEPVEGKPQQVLQKILRIKKEISRIEAYDVSNIQGREATGSLVVFTDGRPDKSQYRKFKIKITRKQNDVAMIKEILSRRLKHPEWPFPDLILIDGGRAQLNTALQCLKWKIKQIRVVALAKKKNELFVEDQKKPILLKTLPREIFNLILQLRDEAHRFARKYHHKLREIDFLPRS